MEATLPALVSVVEKINEPRYPSFKGIMAAKKKPMQTLSLADLGVDAGDRSALAARVERGRGVHCAAAAEAGTIVTDEGDGGVKLAEYLAAAKVHLSGTDRTMAEVLVLVEHVDGEVKKVTHELLTIARRAG